MVNILTKESKGGLSLIDAGFISVGKSLLVEPIVTPALNQFTGGNSILNALAKVLVGGFVGNAVGGKVGTAITGALVISAGDDIIRPLIGGGVGAATPMKGGGGGNFGQANQQEGIMEFI